MQDKTVRVPKPSHASFDRDRPLSRNQLLATQVLHFYEMEQTLPKSKRTGIELGAIQTEGEAADYIRKVTHAVHPHNAPKKKRKAKAKRAG